MIWKRQNEVSHKLKTRIVSNDVRKGNKTVSRGIRNGCLLFWSLNILEVTIMSKGKRGINLKLALLICVPALIIAIMLVRFLNNSKAADLQNLLQNLNKEISQSINTAASNQKSEADLLQHFEQLANEIKSKQEDQAKQFERQRRILEKKIQNLKETPLQGTLRERLAYTFEYDGNHKFPAFIWQTKSSIESESVKTHEQEAQWREKNPGFVHEVTNDDMANALVHYFYGSIPEVIEAYDALPSKILKIDFFKYLVLLARGGVYADVDTAPIQAIPNWIPENVEPHRIGLILGIEHDASAPDWKSRFVRRLQFSTWIIQAKAGHPVLREIVAQITEKTLERQKDQDSNVNLRNDLTIMSWTGSGLWTDVIFTYLNDYMRSGITEKTTWKDFQDLRVPKLISDILVFPSYSFNAPSEIKNNDAWKNLYFASHKGKKSWKAVPKVEGN